MTRSYYDLDREPQARGRPMSEGIGGTLSFSDATPIMTCQCGGRCFGDSINDALKAWSGHVTTEHRDDWG